MKLTFLLIPTHNYSQTISNVLSITSSCRALAQIRLPTNDKNNLFNLTNVKITNEVNIIYNFRHQNLNISSKFL